MNTTMNKTLCYQVFVAYPLYNKEVVFEQGRQGYGCLEKSAPNGGNYSGEDWDDSQRRVEEQGIKGNQYNQEKQR